jgi:hypothetical protein
LLLESDRIRHCHQQWKRRVRYGKLETMPGIIQMKDGTTATFDGVSWESDDSELAGRLNEHLDEYLEFKAPIEYNPNPAQRVVELAAAAFNAEILQRVKDPPSRPGVVY